MIVDVEETCARLGRAIAAIVKNVDGPAYALASERVVAAADVDPALTSCEYLVPFFTPAHRVGASRDAGARGFTRAATVVDPTAMVAQSATFGSGTYVNSGAVIGGAVRAGAFVFINRSASIGHLVELGDFSSVGPGAILCGSVRIGRGAVVAAGATILPKVEIGQNSVVAAGAVVRESVGDHCLVAGNPARQVAGDYRGYGGFSV